MNQKTIAIILIIAAIVFATFVYMVRARSEATIELLVTARNGNCYLDDGTCLHGRDNSLYIFGGSIVGALLILGLYLFFFDRATRQLEEQHKTVSEALKEAKLREKSKDEFNAFLSGFTEEERKILLAVKAQEGIKQSTLRFKTGLSKTTVSLVLKSLEERSIISREEDGKTNKVWLQKKF